MTDREARLAQRRKRREGWIRAYLGGAEPTPPEAPPEPREVKPGIFVVPVSSSIFEPKNAAEIMLNPPPFPDLTLNDEDRELLGVAPPEPARCVKAATIAALRDEINALADRAEAVAAECLHPEDRRFKAGQALAYRAVALRLCGVLTPLTVEDAHA